MGWGGEYTEGTAWKWEWGTCRCARHHALFSARGLSPLVPPLPHTKRDLAPVLLGEVKSVS